METNAGVAGEGSSLADRAETATGSTVTVVCMSTIDHDEVVRRSFEQQTALFSGPDSLFAPRPGSTLSWVEPLRTDDIVLDVACGAAHLSEQIAPHVRQVVGIDLTPALLALGADRLVETGTTNVLLQEGNANALPFVDGSFDVVVCRSSMHHFADYEQPLREMARVCRPSGRVVILDMVAPSADVREEFDALHRSIDPSHVAVLLEPELAELVARIVGPLTHGETSTSPAIPVELMLTDASDRATALGRLEAELAGRTVTGLAPAATDDGLVVTFTTTVVHATVAAH
jgi:SAM-dependent methyltransferase